jgi:sugar phosphate isomerase/epimerase
MRGYFTLAVQGGDMKLAARVPPLANLEESPASLLQRVAEGGFDGVVLAGLAAPHLPDVASAIGETGLTLVAAHVPFDRLQAERKTVVRELRTVGCERVVVPPMHEAHFESRPEVNRLATRLSAMGGRLAADGRQLCYANAAHEFEDVGDGTAYELLIDRAGDGLAFEFDAGWTAVADRDPVAVLGALSGRAPLVVATPRVPETGERRLPGRGAVDLPAVADAAAAAGADWLVHVAASPPLHDAELDAAADALREALP